MTEIEKKAQEMKAQAEEAARKAANEVIEAERKKDQDAREKAEKELKEAKEALKKAQEMIENLDKTAKEQEKKIEEMMRAEARRAVERKLEDRIVEVILSKEAKEKFEKVIKNEQTSAKIEFKADSPTITQSTFSVQQVPGVSSARYLPNAFLDMLNKVQITAEKLSWLEGNYTTHVGYVDRLTKVGTDDTATVAEKTRGWGKLASRLPISSENQNWLATIVAWAKNEGVRNMLSKVDTEIINGDGDETASNKHISGLKTQGSTAFAKFTQYPEPTIAEVLFDAAKQAQKKGFFANMAFVSMEIEAQLQTLKDKNGNFIYNQVTGMLGQLRIIASSKLTEKEAYVLDSNCVSVYEKGAYEMELVRDADIDGYIFHLRGHFQVKVSTEDKKGVIYIADVTTALTEITKA